MVLTTTRKLPRQGRSHALVEAIVEAAARIVVRDGRDALTTNAVAEVAGVSIGSLYQYFPNRAAVIGAVTERHDALLRACMGMVDVTVATSLDGAVARIVAAAFAAHRIEPALHLALARDLAGQGDAGALPLGTKPVILAALLALPPALRCEIARPHADIAAAVAGEIIHALAHRGASGDGDAEQEAIAAVLAYLRAAPYFG